MQTKESQSAITPVNALEMLKEGNSRFTKDSMLNKNLLQQVSDTSTGQFPFAVILSCIDSRVPVETIFDQGIGDLFSIRIAGNVVNEDILGSMEFACKAAGSKLIVVLGHSSCGAVKGACDSVEMGNLTGLLGKILPAVKTVTQDKGESSNSKDSEYVQQVADQNVLEAIRQIKDNSSILSKMIEDGEIDIAGAMYYIDSGKVCFFEN